jgi:miniconductance mechanosensitive channel
MDLSHVFDLLWVRRLAGVAILLAVAWLAGAVARFLLFRVVRRLAERTAWRWDDALFQYGTFKWVARMVPTVVVQFGIGAVPELPAHAAALAAAAAAALMVFFGAMAVAASLSAIEHVYHASPHGSRRSLKGVVQMLKLLVFVVAALVVVGVVTGKQIGLLLSGLGALSAVLLLVFKDTILGFVAGVQLTSNDMLRVGDWITMPGAGADGDVLDITLYSVKVRNFDQTIVTIPTWKLVSESYQNWRGMQESGGRRIKRSLYLDASSVRFLDEGELAALSRLRLLGDYLAGKREELDRWNGGLGEAAALAANRRRLTNLGTFRAYAQAYLRSRPDIRKDMTCMVRHLAAEARGIPLELYAFTATTAWAEYEGIQADIFEHLSALLPEFGLRLFQEPSGYDVRAALGALPGPRPEASAPRAGGQRWPAST